MIITSMRRGTLRGGVWFTVLGTLIFLGFLQAPRRLEAARYCTPERIWEEYQNRQGRKLPEHRPGSTVEKPFALSLEKDEEQDFFSFDYPYRFDLEAEFVRTLQVDDPGHPDDGGMREAEHLLDIIQSDNTQESIWVWCRYFEITGDDRYRENIDDAWGYVMRNPAYREEGGGGPLGYYRVYNCGWGLRAEMIFRDVYGDTTFKAYADSICDYLADNRLNLEYPVPPYYLLNGLVQGWAVGNYYEYAVTDGREDHIAAAIEIAADVKDWVESDPATFLSEETWAMSGGATVWGLIKSYFQEFPDELPAWVEEYGPCLDTYEGYGEWHNAWNGWYALGHYFLWSSSGDMMYKGYHKSLTDLLLLQDGDLDGGIPASESEPDDHDQSWVSNYLAYMGLEPMRPVVDLLLADVPDTLAGGDSWSYRALMVSNRDEDIALYGLAGVLLPGNEPYAGNPVYGPVRTHLGPFEHMENLIEGSVPGIAPEGEYTLHHIIATDRENIIDRDRFSCEVR